MKTTITVMITVTIILYFNTLSMTAVAATNCQRSNQLFNQSLNTAPVTMRAHLLKQAIKQCASHSQALNNLAILKEKQQRFREAEMLYQRASQVDPNFSTAYAGLGDTQRALGRYRDAALSYRFFLTFATSPENPEAETLKPHLPIYQKRLEQTLLQANKAGDATAQEIVKVLATEQINPSATRAFRRKPFQPKLDLTILFHTGSATIQNTSNTQLQEIAHALTLQRLKNSRIQIEGHTDSVGSDHANLTLSKQRAEGVQKRLIG